MSEFVRARRPEQKQQRREAILAAARRLAAESGVNNVSLGGVAAAVGLAKSNVVRYFGTREEIYLELAGEGWREWRDAVVERLDAGDDAVDTLAETLEARPLFCDLLSHDSISLEHNASVAAAYDYKRIMVEVIGELGAAVARARPPLTDGEGFELVVAAIGIVRLAYPAAHPSPTLIEVYKQHPDLAAARPQFTRTVKRLLAATAAGLPTLRT
ncbi:TetR family transcriptional regulator [Glycomyces luteolus]|uniref:TetR family transcriptional regulator n=1 Tax=Glycomyces luteolus TaxID=2670330 RepID=A0A9X3PH41_9ACTN|nr:TetR family transcriptional regulator [Glycomyces luteolus]MDA1362479.1 TetR family transcriptional regulator [Glycomyces luteolus]